MRASFFDLYDTILIVDDDNLSSLLIKIKIQQLTEVKNIQAYDNARDALHTLNEICEDSEKRKVLIFLDIHMPKITGLHFIDFLRNFENIANHEINVVVISGEPDPELHYGELTDPFVIGVNEKPIEMNKVLEQIQEAKIKQLQL